MQKTSLLVHFERYVKQLGDADIELEVKVHEGRICSRKLRPELCVPSNRHDTRVTHCSASTSSLDAKPLPQALEEIILAEVGPFGGFEGCVRNGVITRCMSYRYHCRRK